MQEHEYRTEHGVFYKDLHDVNNVSVKYSGFGEDDLAICHTPAVNNHIIEEINVNCTM